MPTGYTADIKDGITFDQYAMACARAFGALVIMRDEASSSIIPETFAPDDYHKRGIVRAKQDLQAAEDITLLEAEEAARDEWIAAEASRKEGLNKNSELIAKYKSMLTEVINWKPPTEEHKGLHKFMREQIEESIKFDCMDEYYRDETERLSGEEWLINKKKKAIQDIEYHTEKYQEEVDRTEGRNKWISALRDSLINPIN